MTNRPLISVILPFRQIDLRLRLAIASLVNQTLGDFEILLCGDGVANVDTRQFRFLDDRVKLCGSEIWRGLPTRLNECILSARGKYIARMDSDDISYPERFAAQVNYLEANPPLALVGTQVVVFDMQFRAKGGRLSPRTHEEICLCPNGGFKIAHPTFLGRAEWFRLNRYDPRARRCEDQDLLLRTYRRHRFGNVQQVLLGYYEDTIALGKLLSSRMHWAQSVWRVNQGLRGAVTGMSVGALGVAKFAYESFATLLSLDPFLLRHRACIISEEETQRWRRVIQSLQVSVGSYTQV